MGWVESQGELCGGAQCYGICYSNETVSNCYSKSVAGWCFGERQNLLIMLVVLIGINTLCYLISLLKKVHITFWTYFNDILANVLFSLLVAGASCLSNGLSSQGLAFTLVGAFAGFIRWISLTCLSAADCYNCDCCKEEDGCCGKNNGIASTMYKMHTQPVTQLELQDNIKQILTQPPQLNVQGYTYNTTTIYIAHGNTRKEDRVEKQKTVSTPFSQQIEYTSWQEDAPAASIPEGKNLLMKTVVHYEETPELLEEAKIKIQQIRQEAQNTSESSNLYLQASVEGQQNFVIGAGSGSKVPCLYSFCSTSFGFFLWFIVGFFGLCCPYELIWILGITPIELYSVKKISSDQKYRNSYQQPESEPPQINYV